MPEKPPRPESKSPQKPETKEAAERPPRFRTIEDEVITVFEDGSKLHKVLECNGLHHRICLDIIYYDDKGEIIFVNEQIRKGLGSCDGKHA